MAPEITDHLTLWNLGPQQLCLDFQGGRIVSDAGLLAVRALERPLRVIADLAAQLPDPRSPKFIRHSVEALLTQEVYALLAGYPDHNDADDLRTDPLFQILADVSPDTEQPLASGSTMDKSRVTVSSAAGSKSVRSKPAGMAGVNPADPRTAGSNVSHDGASSLNSTSSLWSWSMDVKSSNVSSGVGAVSGTGSSIATVVSCCV